MTEETKGVRFAFSKKGLVLTSRSAEAGESTINFPCKFDGPDVEIGACIVNEAGRFETPGLVLAAGQAQPLLQRRQAENIGGSQRIGETLAPALR